MLPYIAVGAGAGGIAVLALCLYVWTKRRTVCSCMYTRPRQRPATQSVQQHQQHQPQHHHQQSTLNNTDQTVETGRYAETPPGEFTIDYEAAVAEIDSVYDNDSPPPENPFLGDMSV